MATKPRVVITREAHYRMFQYAKEATGEITGFGTVEQEGDCLRVTDVFIMPQTAGAAHVNVTGETLLDLHKWFRDQGTPERIEKTRFWWHSHVNMQAFRSGTDEGTVKLLLSVMPYLVCTVVNKKMEHLTSVHLKDPVNLTFDNLPLVREDFSAQGVCEQVASEVKEYVTTQRYVPHKHPESNGIPLIGDARAVGEKPAVEIVDTWDRYAKQQEDQHGANDFGAGITDKEWEEWKKIHMGNVVGGD